MEEMVKRMETEDTPFIEGKNFTNPSTPSGTYFDESCCVILLKVKNNVKNIKTNSDTIIKVLLLYK